MKARVLNILVALDVFLFALVCLGNVKRGETASAAAYSLWLDGKWQGKVFMPLINLIFWDKDHCLHAWMYEQDEKDTA